MTDHDPDPEDLWASARDGNIEQVAYLLNQYHMISDYMNHRDDEDGTTPLIVAIKYSHIFSSVHFDRITGLDFDHTNRHLAVVKLLLRCGADVSVECNSGTTALYWAMLRAPSNEYMDLLIETPGIDIDQKVNGCTALMLAIDDKYYRPFNWKYQVSTLLHHGADTTTLDGNGNSILHQRCSPDQWLLDTLRPFNIDVNRRCELGRTPLLYAIDFFKRQRNGGIFEEFASVVSALLENGADIQIKDDTGRLAIEVAGSFIPEDHHAMLLLREKDFRDRMMVFATGTHRRNHPDCNVRDFYPEVIRMILDRGKIKN